MILHITYQLVLDGPSGNIFTAQRHDNERILVESNYTLTDESGHYEKPNNRPFSLGKPDDPIEIDDQLISNKPYDSIQKYVLRQNHAIYGSVFLPTVGFSIDLLSGQIGVTLLRQILPVILYSIFWNRI